MPQLDLKHDIHWKAPALMLVALVAGLLLAIGHHEYYHSLDKQVVENGIWDQQMNIRIGNAFAFLVRAALSLAVGAAYWQIFWSTMLSKPLSVTVIDSLAGLLTAILEFFNLAALRAKPILFGFAVISWLVPLVTIITPATLSVTTTQQPYQDVFNTSLINFESSPMAAITVNYLFETANFSGPSQALSRLTLGTAIQGQLPSLPFPAENSSFSTSFAAPAVQCNEADIGLMSDLIPAVSCIGDAADCVDKSVYLYLSWVPDASELIPFKPDNLSSINGSTVQTSSLSNSDDTTFLSSYSDGPAMIFVAVDLSVGSTMPDWSLLNCSLWNATYDVEFNVVNTRQNVSVTKLQYEHGVSADWLSDAYSDAESVMPRIPNLSYQSLMECLGKLLVGSSYHSGSLGVNQSLTYDDRIYISTAAMQTELASTAELFPIYNYTSSNNFSASGVMAAADDAVKSPFLGQPLARLIEMLFRNMTLALYSRSEFLYDDATTPTNVTIKSWQNIYVYTAYRLGLAYGLAVGFTCICVLLGLYTIWHTGASYSNKFSTIMRTTCAADLGALVSVKDRDGSDPLPKYLEKLKIQVGAAAVRGKEAPLIQSGTEDVELVEYKAVAVSVGDSEETMSLRQNPAPQ